MSEFEDQINELGELPEDILGSSERDELRSYGKAGSGHVSIPPSTGRVPVSLNPPTGLPSDIAVESAIRGESGPPGSPPIPASVTTTWDARPINARDFLQTRVGTMEIDTGDPPSIKLENEYRYTVPEGYVGVLRGFSYSASVYTERSLSSLDNGDFSAPVASTLLIDSLIVPDYESMDLGQSANFQIPTFVIALAGQTFILRTVHDASIITAIHAALGGRDSVINTRATLYGQILLSRGLPSQFEIMSQNWSGRNNT